MSNYGRETIQIVEIDVPFCSREYGDAAFSPPGSCTAVLGVTGDRKCYNTRATCQDAANYSPATVTLRFARPQLDILQYGPIIPSLLSVSTTPGAINLAAMDRSASALGQREVVTAMLQDSLHSDHQVDKYRLERANGAASFEASGTAQAGAASSLTLAATALDVVVGRTLRLTGGAGSAQERSVFTYDSVTKVATVASPWRVNKLLWSEGFDNAVWVNSAIGVASAPVVTANAGLAPDGTMTADRVQLALNGGSTSGDISNIGQVTVSTVGLRFGVWLKSNTGGNQIIALFTSNGQGANITVTPAWQFFTHSSAFVGSSSSGFRIRGSFGHTDAADVLAWGTQLADTEAALGEYIKTTAAAVALPDATTTYEVIDKNGIVADPYLAFVGRLDVPVIDDAGASCVISMQYESRLIDLQRTRERRWTHEDQQIDFPGDLGFEYVTSLPDQVLIW